MDPRHIVDIWRPEAAGDGGLTLDMSLTLIGLAATAALAVFAGWRGARPPDFQRGPRMVPWRPLMAASATAFLIFLVHLVNLLGITTGQTSP